MSIKMIKGCVVSCDGGCDRSVVVPEWQDAAKLGWAVPCDGGIQLCPVCVKRRTATVVQEGRLQQMVEGCPLAQQEKT